MQEPDINQGRMSHIPIPTSILWGFGIPTDSPTQLLPGGEGTTYLVPQPIDVVFKPCRDPIETEIICKILSQLNPINPEFRISQPLLPEIDKETFIYQNWSASKYIRNVCALSQVQGEYTTSRIREIIIASRAFHAALRGTTISSSDADYLKHGVGHVWAMSHRTVWSSDQGSSPQDLLSPFALEPTKDLSHPYVCLIQRIVNLASYLGSGPTHNQRLYKTSSQIIHGDLVGGDNVLFDISSFPSASRNSPSPQVQPPVIIDLSPTIAPEAYAEGILLADAMIWCPNIVGLELLDLDLVGGATYVNLDMLRRGLMFRLLSDIGLVERGHEAARPDIVEAERVISLLEEHLGVAV